MMPKKAEFILCAQCNKKTEKKSHNQKYCIPCIDVVAKIKRDKKKQAELNLKKDDRHELYKRMLGNMLLNFYVDIKVYSNLTETQLENFIKKWVEKHIKTPVENWIPVDLE